MNDFTNIRHNKHKEQSKFTHKGVNQNWLLIEKSLALVNSNGIT